MTEKTLKEFAEEYWKEYSDKYPRLFYSEESKEAFVLAFAVGAEHALKKMKEKLL